MPEYLSPGVYMEEFEIGAKPIEGVSTSTAGFLGETERGPTTPCLITSWLQYQRVFGGYFGNDKYLPGSVDGFFKNGGARCYIARIVKSQSKDKTESAATMASLNLKLPDNNFLIVEAVGEGEWGNRVAVKLGDGIFGGIKLDVLYWKVQPPSNDYISETDLNKIIKEHPPTVFETFTNISTSNMSPDYFEKTVTGISNLIKISMPDASFTAPNSSSDSFLTGGNDGGLISKDPINASLKLHSIDTIDSQKCAEYKDAILIVNASNPGAEGNRIGLKLDKGTSSGIKLTVYPDINKKDKTEFSSDDLSIDDIVTNVNDPDHGSKYINISILKNYRKASDKILNLDGGSTDKKASLTVHSIDTFDCKQLNEYRDKTLIVNALNKGAEGNKIGLKLEKGTNSGIKLVVYPDIDKQEETEFSSDDLSIKDFEKKVNDLDKGSKYIEILIQDSESEKASTEILKLEGGKDSEKIPNFTVKDYVRSEENKPGERKGLAAFNEIEDISIVYAPNAYAISGLVTELISHCESLRYRFAILDAPQGSSNFSDLDPRSNKPEGSSPTDFAAFYYPWIKIINPETGLTQLMPPGGYIAGIYARSDIEKGVHKAPANEVVRGASDLEFQIMKGEQDILNPRGVNVIRAFSGRGILVWGARTLSSNTLWKYINVRRLFIYVEDSIERGTQWVVFEPNDERLWARVKATVTQFLTGVWRSGALMGATPEQAFFVKCDRSTMTQDDIDNGRLVCIIGIAPVKPAEFVIFKIAQWQGGSAATE